MFPSFYREISLSANCCHHPSRSPTEQYSSQRGLGAQVSSRTRKRGAHMGLHLLGVSTRRCQGGTRSRVWTSLSGCVPGSHWPWDYQATYLGDLGVAEPCGARFLQPFNQTSPPLSLLYLKSDFVKQVLLIWKERFENHRSSPTVTFQRWTDTVRRPGEEGGATRSKRKSGSDLGHEPRSPGCKDSISGVLFVFNSLHPTSICFIL